MEVTVGEEDILFTELVIGEIDTWKAKIAVNGHETLFKLDTGADGTVVSHSEPWLHQVELKKARLLCTVQRQ